MTPRWNDLNEGCEPEPWTVGPITRTHIVRYQGACGDMNPIHHDEPYAKGAGFDAPLGIGMLHAGMMNTWAVRWLGPENIRRTKIRWKEAVWPGDMLTFSGTFIRKYDERNQKLVDIEMSCVRQNGRIAAQGWATFVVND